MDPTGAPNWQPAGNPAEFSGCNVSCFSLNFQSCPAAHGMAWHGEKLQPPAMIGSLSIFLGGLFVVIVVVVVAAAHFKHKGVFV